MLHNTVELWEVESGRLVRTLEGHLGPVLRIEPVIHLTDDEFYHLCVLNRDLRMERTAQGEIVIMSPAGTQRAASPQQNDPQERR